MQGRKTIKILATVTILVIICVAITYVKSDTKEVLATTKEFNSENLQENEHMHIEEDASEDKVPVPNGYVGSKATGENEIDTGYVIYEGTEEVNNSNVEEAKKTRNQYVWIPVPDASTMYGTDANGKKWGKLYDFAMSSNNENYDEVTGAYPLNWSESNGIMEIINSKLAIEPYIIIRADITQPYDMDSNIKNLKIEENSHNFLIELEYEFNSMVNSIEKYGGFYIGRYETGKLNQEQIAVVKNTNETGSQSWYTQYMKCKGLKKENINIETGMIWGSQWDRTLMWLVESGDKTKEEICEDSTNWGNYKNATFSYEDVNGNTFVKEAGKNNLIPTGNSEYTKANNIYDMAGNVWEWTMESSTSGRKFRGGSWVYEGNDRQASCNIYRNPNDINSSIRLPCNAIYKINKKRRDTYEQK